MSRLDTLCRRKRIPSAWRRRAVWFRHPQTMNKIASRRRSSLSATSTSRMTQYGTGTISSYGGYALEGTLLRSVLVSFDRTELREHTDTGSTDQTGSRSNLTEADLRTCGERRSLYRRVVG